MAKKQDVTVRQKIIAAAIELIRRHGYVATTVDQICQQAEVSKGAFFHYFANKDALGLECLHEWNCRFEALYESASQGATKPVDRLLGCVDFYIELFQRPGLGKSCLAGTIVQEVAESHPALRDAAQNCFKSGAARFQQLLEDARRERNAVFDTASVARMFLASIQGSLLLAKASQDASVISETLTHYRRYLESLLTTK
jgi:TetR/AcrR family transcriptional repressor of nem operon